MKRIISVLLTALLILSSLASCKGNTSGNIETTTPETTLPEPETLKPKPYPNALQVSAYSMLTDSEKNLYENIARIIASPIPGKVYALKKKANLTSFNMVLDILKANFGSHIEVLENVKYEEADGKILSVKLDDNFDLEDFNTEYEAITKKADEIVASLSKDLSYRELVFEIVDILIENTDYVSEEEETSVYTTLIEGKADSEGFAQTFDLLCKKAGFEGFAVYAYQSKNSYDIQTNISETTYPIIEPKKYWNFIKIWNKWYQLDIPAIREFYAENFEKFIDLDKMFGQYYLPYYFYRNSFDKMIIPTITPWSESNYKFSSVTELTELLKASKLYTSQSSNAGGNYYVTFADSADALKATELDRTQIKDCTGETFTIYLTKYDYDKTVEFITVSKSDEEISAENVDFRNITVNYYNSIGESYSDDIACDVTVSLDIPVTWTGEGQGPNYYQYRRIVMPQDNSQISRPYHHSVFSFGLLYKVSEDFKCDADIRKNLKPYYSDNIDDIPQTGVNRYGVEYASFLKIGDANSIGTIPGFMYDCIYLRISPEYILELYFTESESYTDVVWKVIDSVRIENNS